MQANLQVHLEWLVLDGGVQILQLVRIEVLSVVQISKIFDEVFSVHLSPDILNMIKTSRQNDAGTFRRYRIYSKMFAYLTMQICIE